MSSDVAARMHCNATWKAAIDDQSAVATVDWPQFIDSLMDLPQELRDEILKLSVPEHIKLSFFELSTERDPAFVPIIAQEGNERLRHECILATLQNTMFRVATEKYLVKLRKWLASIDFESLPGNDKKDGFDAVRRLEFSDKFHVETHRQLAVNFAADGTRHGSCSSLHPRVKPSSWEQDLELTRMCRDLRTVHMEVCLPDYLLDRLSRGRNMEQVLQAGRNSPMHPFQRLLSLKGLKRLRLTFFTSYWETTQLNVERERRITCWLHEEFEMLGESVEVVSEFGWWG